jgi:6-phosphofructokinase 2
MRIATVTMNPAIDISTHATRVVPTQKLRCTTVRRDAGGGGINVARVIKRLGGDARAFYPIGGPIGELLVRLVSAEQIESETVLVADDTRQSFTVEEDDTGEQYRFVLPGPELSESEWRQCLAAVEEMGIPKFLVLSGSLPVGVPNEFFATMARDAKARGIRVIVDTSGPALAAALEEGVFLVKPNLRELQDYVGSPIEGREAWLAASRRLVDEGRAEVVALTLGHLGGLLATRRQAVFAPVLPVKPVSAVGAGDSFVAAMVWGLAEGYGTEDAFRYGMAAGSAALLSPGTELCNVADIQRLYPQVSLEPL